MFVCALYTFTATTCVILTFVIVAFSGHTYFPAFDVLFSNQIGLFCVFRSRGAVCMSMVFECNIYDHTSILLTLAY